MSKKVFLCSLIVLVLAMAPSAFAGKVELTTYYPAPYGEYSQLKATGSTNSNTDVVLEAGGNAGTGLVVTNANNVGIGTTAPQAKLDVAGDIRAESNHWGTCTWRYVGAPKSHNSPSGSAIYCQDGEYLAGFDINSCNNASPYDAPGQEGQPCTANDSPFVYQAYCCKI